MFRYFENFIDPYSEYTQTDTPPTTLWAFLRGYYRPFYGLLALITLTEMSIVALELGVIFGVGWFVDVIHTTPNLIVDYAVRGLIALAVFICCTAQCATIYVMVGKTRHRPRSLPPANRLWRMVLSSI